VEMGTQPDPACPVAFGPFEFDEVSAQLRKHGHVLRLPGQSLQILLILVHRPGQIISRDEFQDADTDSWPPYSGLRGDPFWG
jgi:DNA-binding response OmpR family regulator